MAIPCGIVPPKLKKKDLEGHKKAEMDMNESLQKGNDELKHILALFELNDYSAIELKIKEYKKSQKENLKVNAMFNIRFVKCTCCYSGYIQPEFQIGFGENMKTEKLEKIVVSEIITRHLSTEN